MSLYCTVFEIVTLICRDFKRSCDQEYTTILRNFITHMLELITINLRTKCEDFTWPTRVQNLKSLVLAIPEIFQGM